MARALAHGDEHEQAAFFNAFFRDLRGACKANGNSFETQLFYITRNLDGPAREVIVEWAASVAFEREEDETRRREYATKREEISRLNKEIGDLEARKRAAMEELDA